MKGMENTDVIRNKIYWIRGEQVMLDSDLAQLYGVETKQLKRQVRRNAIRFPDDFMFQLSGDEVASLRCQNGTTKGRGGSRYSPFAFTASGIAMLSSVLTSDTAALANIRIMRAFVAMRKQLSELAAQKQQIDRLELRVDRLNDYVESILHDQNEINEEIAMQIELINQSIAELKTEKVQMDNRPKIGFVTGK